ncbi:hypothetical protein, partial [Primorskyibacter flagellatus]
NLGLMGVGTLAFGAFIREITHVFERNILMSDNANLLDTSEGHQVRRFLHYIVASTAAIR